MFHSGSISVIMLRNINICNANCLHCNISKEQKVNKLLSIESLELAIQKLLPYLDKNYLQVVWEGGEVMLAGVEYYYKALEVFHKYLPNTEFSMQTNFLIYNKKVQKMYDEVFKNRISSSYDFYSPLRQIGNSNEKYQEIFFKNIKEYKEKTPYNIFLITVLNQWNKDKYKEIWGFCKENKIDYRLNPLYIKGNAKDNNLESLSEEDYNKAIIETNKYWLYEKNQINFTPSMNLLEKYLFNSNKKIINECPFTCSCTGTFISLEYNGDISNCIEIANLPEYKFGNIFKDNPIDIFTKNQVVKKLQKRKVKLNEDCVNCEYFYACQGGCMALSLIRGLDVSEKYEYCEGYKGIFKEFDKFDKITLEKFYAAKKMNVEISVNLV